MATKKIIKIQLADRIAEAIRLGEFRAGEWLRQIDLEQKFKATRFEVRRALDALVIRQTIEHVANRGYRVAEISEQLQQDIIAVRMVVEASAAEHVGTNATHKDIEQLTLLAEAFSQAVKSGTILEQSKTNQEFHRYFFAMCKNPVLEELIWSLRERARITSFTIWKSHESQILADQDHYDLIELIRLRDIAGLINATKQHILRN